MARNRLEGDLAISRSLLKQYCSADKLTAVCLKSAHCMFHVRRGQLAWRTSVFISRKYLMRFSGITADERATAHAPGHVQGRE